MQKTLLRHIQISLEDNYIDYITDKGMRLIKQDIPIVLEYLFRNYVKVPSEEFKQKEAEVLNISFNPVDPTVLIYCPIEQLHNLANDANIPYSNAQQSELGLTLIRSTRDFEKGLSDWNSKPDPDKTWLNFKQHFKDYQIELKDKRGPTMQQDRFHLTNMLADQLCTTIET